MYAGDGLMAGMSNVMDEMNNGGDIVLNQLYLDGVKTENLWGFDIYFLGDGHSGFAYMFESRDGKDRFVLKVAHMLLSDPSGYREPLYDGEMLYALRDYPEIVNVYAYGEMWVMMEYIDGRALYDEIGYCDGVAEDHVYTVRDGVAELLERVYNESKIYMFDVHADNVLIDGNGGFRVIDAGMFRVVGTLDDEEREHLVTSWMELIDCTINGEF